MIVILSGFEIKDIEEIIPADESNQCWRLMRQEKVVACTTDKNLIKVKSE
jgi:hypothetical protein